MPRLPAHWLRLQRGAEHLHACGPRYIAHFLAQMTLSLPERMALLDRLDAWRRDIDPVRSRANGYVHPALEWRVLENEARGLARPAPDPRQDCGWCPAPSATSSRDGWRTRLGGRAVISICPRRDLPGVVPDATTTSNLLPHRHKRPTVPPRLSS
jgi:hypothetical protein